jgi:glycosyltransferase involved in cell wall biosynthesis
VRILVLNWQDRENPLAGGAEILLHEVFGRLVAWGHEVTLLCGGWPGCPPTATLDGMRVVRVGTRQTFPFLARRYWERHLRAEPFDVLVEDINKVPLYTTRWGGPPVVAWVPHLFGDAAVTELGLVLGSAVWLSERPLARMYRDVPFEAISQSTADDLVARGIPRGNVRINYPGIAFDVYTPDASLRAAVPTFAYLGRLKRYKGVDIVIRAFALVRDQRAVLEIAGSGDHRPSLERLVESLGLTERVRFLGFIDEAGKQALLRRAWALTLASTKEGWGLTNLEAAASGTPVVASDSPGIRESVRDGETGFLIRHGDVAAFGAALDRLAQDPALVATLGRQARPFAETFTWDRCARNSESLLAEVVAR